MFAIETYVKFTNVLANAFCDPVQKILHKI